MLDDGTVYSFGECALHGGRRTLVRAGRAVHLRPKVYALLAYLLEHRRRAVSREELCNAVWPGTFVSDATLDSTIRALRQALGDNGERQGVIRTLSGYGYLFVETVDASSEATKALGTPDD